MTSATTAPMALAALHGRRSRARSRMLRRPVAMDAGDLLRIVDGEGTRVVARTGILWITDEHSGQDVVLRPGESHRVRGGGVTLVEAHRAARLVIEAPHVACAPAAIEIRFANGGGRLLPLMSPGARRRVEALLQALRRLARSLLTPRVRWPVPDEPRGRRRHKRHDASDFTPEAIRDRLLRSGALRYY